jgi:pimeloyl-ACP methyl ester carboxylesterase
VRSGVFAKLAANYHVIALDCRGFGQSGKPHDPAQYGVEMGLDVIRLLDHLRINTAHVVGYSMGAHIAAHLIRHASRAIHLRYVGRRGRALDLDGS